MSTKRKHEDMEEEIETILIVDCTEPTEPQLFKVFKHLAPKRMQKALEKKKDTGNNVFTIDCDDNDTLTFAELVKENDDDKVERDCDEVISFLQKNMNPDANAVKIPGMFHHVIMLVSQ